MMTVFDLQSMFDVNSLDSKRNDGDSQELHMRVLIPAASTVLRFGNSVLLAQSHPVQAKPVSQLDLEAIFGVDAAHFRLGCECLIVSHVFAEGDCSHVSLRDRLERLLSVGVQVSRLRDLSELGQSTSLGLLLEAWFRND